MLTFSVNGLSVLALVLLSLGCDELHMGCFEMLLNQGLVMANDTCEATITKRLACWWSLKSHLEGG